jgi:rSAM/selenodomain-associated transferase 1
MRMPDAADLPRLVIFARWPEPGKVKTRLAGVYGDEGAARIYRRLLDHTLAAARESGLPVELCVTGAPCSRFEEEFGPGLTVSEQGEDDLGARLARVKPPALVVGSDLPALSPGLLREAAGSLASHEVAIGPARDGGYWLIGLREPMPWLFNEMPWSTPQVLRETLARLTARGIAPALLAELADIDTPEDLAAWPEFLP